MTIKTGNRVLRLFAFGHVPLLTSSAASVYSTMLFPEDGQEMDRFTCAQAICLDWRARYQGGSIEEVLPVVRRELYALLDFTRRVPFKDLLSLRNDGLRAGLILRFVLLLDRDSRLEASVKKAVALMVKFEPLSERTYTSLWARYKGVSHLWAAYNEYCFRLQQAGSEWEITAWRSFMNDPRPVLAFADHYRDWATTHMTKRGKGARTLEASQAWSIPDEIRPLPQASFFDPHYWYEGLTAETREYLARYRRA